MTKPAHRNDIRLTDYLKPKNWPVLMGLGILKLIALLPLTTVRTLGTGLGKLSFKLAHRRRKIAQTNLKLCFPDLNSEQQQNLLRQVFENTGMGLLEIACAWFSNLARSEKHFNIHGLEHLQQAKAKNKGVILLSFHLTSLELGGTYFGRANPDFVAIYKPHRNPFFDRAMYNGRKRICEPVEKSNVRQILKALKQNKMIWYAADQDYGRAQSVFVPFFGINTATITGTSWFAKKSGAEVIPMTHIRTKKGMEIQLHPALENFAKEDDVADAATVMAFLENYLHQYPADYMWVHRRFKTRPIGEESYYKNL